MATSGVEDEEILEVLRSADAPRLTTTEVADELPITRGRTRTRLQRLTEDDELERKTVGNEVVWWLPERTDELDEWEEEHADDEQKGDGTDTPPGEGTADEGAAEEGGEAASDEPADEGEATPEERPADAEGPDGEAKSVETPEVDESGEPAEAGAEASGEADGATADAGETETAAGADEADAEQAGGGEPSTGPEQPGGEEGGPAEIEVEPVADEITTGGSVTAVDREEPRVRPAGQGDGGNERPLRALAALATAVVVAAILRRLFGRGRRG